MDKALCSITLPSGDRKKEGEGGIEDEAQKEWEIVRSRKEERDEIIP